MPEYISRETLRDLMYTEAFERDTGLQRWDSGLWIRYKLFENCIEAIPAADVVEVRHGQWTGVATGWECSVCTIVSNNTYPHCPYCGAVMYGGQEDE